MDSKKVVAAVTYNPSLQKFLLMKRADERTLFPGYWEFPSGFIKENELIEDAALRELKEETSLKGEIIRIGESFRIDQPEAKICPVLIKVNEKNVDLSREHSKFEWVNLEDIKELSTVPKLDKDLENIGVN